MKLWKRWAAVLLALAVCGALLAGCEKDKVGMTLAVCLGSEPANLDPIYARAEEDQTIVAHLCEDLMRVTVDGAVHAGAAQQRRVGGIDDRLRVRTGDVSHDDVESLHKTTSLRPVYPHLRKTQGPAFPVNGIRRWKPTVFP